LNLRVRAAGHHATQEGDEILLVLGEAVVAYGAYLDHRQMVGTRLRQEAFGRNVIFSPTDLRKAVAAMDAP